MGPPRRSWLRPHAETQLRALRMIRVRIIRGAWRPSKVESTAALPPTSNVSGPRPASVAAFEINAHCGVVMGQRRHYRRRAVLGEHFTERSGSASSCRKLCLSKIKCGHIGGAARRELGGKESARSVRRYATTAHPSPRRDVCGRHYNMSCTTAAGDGGSTRRTRQRGRGIPVGSNRSAVRHTCFAMETAETSADRECPLIELVG